MLNFSYEDLIKERYEQASEYIRLQGRIAKQAFRAYCALGSRLSNDPQTSEPIPSYLFRKLVQPSCEAAFPDYPPRSWTGLNLPASVTHVHTGDYVYEGYCEEAMPRVWFASIGSQANNTLTRNNLLNGSSFATATKYCGYARYRLSQQASGEMIYGVDPLSGELKVASQLVSNRTKLHTAAPEFVWHPIGTVSNPYNPPGFDPGTSGVRPTYQPPEGVGKDPGSPLSFTLPFGWLHLPLSFSAGGINPRIDLGGVKIEPPGGGDSGGGEPPLPPGDDPQEPDEPGSEGSPLERTDYDPQDDGTYSPGELYAVRFTATQVPQKAKRTRPLNSDPAADLCYWGWFSWKRKGIEGERFILDRLNYWAKAPSWATGVSWAFYEGFVGKVEVERLKRT